MKKLTDLFTSLATKVGIAADNPALVALKNIDALKNIEVDDALATKIDTELMSKSAALNNADILATVKANVLDGIDNLLPGLVDEIGLGDEVKTKITGEKNTSQKLKLLAAAAKEHTSKAPDGGKKPADWDAKEKQLRDEIKLAKDETERVRKESDVKLENVELTYHHRSTLANKPLAFDKKMKPHVRDAMVLTAINSALEAAGVVAKLEGGVVKLKTKEGTVYYDKTQKEVSYDDFVDGVLAENGMLTVTPPAPPSGGGNGGSGDGGNGGHGNNGQAPVISHETQAHLDYAKDQWKEETTN